MARDKMVYLVLAVKFTGSMVAVILTCSEIRPAFG